MLTGEAVIPLRSGAIMARSLLVETITYAAVLVVRALYAFVVSRSGRCG
jgi:hypothetical protein